VQQTREPALWSGLLETLQHPDIEREPGGRDQHALAVRINAEPRETVYESRQADGRRKFLRAASHIHRKKAATARRYQSVWKDAIKLAAVSRVRFARITGSGYFENFLKPR
jgi:hypothetical protein